MGMTETQNRLEKLVDHSFERIATYPEAEMSFKPSSEK